MDIQQGYKQTEFGIIPEDWEVKCVQNIFDFPTRTIPCTSFPIRDYVGTENMLPYKRGIVAFENELGYQTVKEYTENDILLSNIRPYLQKIWLSDRCGGCSSDVLVFRVKNTEQNYPAFLYYILSSDDFFKYSMNNAIGTKMPRGDKSAIKEYCIKTPFFHEQRAIAKALNDIDGLIAALDRKIAKKRLIKQGAMQQLLTGKKRLPGFVGEWIETKLGDIANIYQPHTIAQEFFSIHGYNVYGANGLIGKYTKYNHTTNQVLVTCRGSSCGTP